MNGKTNKKVSEIQNSVKKRCISNCRIPSLRGTKQSSIQRLHWIASTTSCLAMTERLKSDNLKCTLKKGDYIFQHP